MRKCLVNFSGKIVPATFHMWTYEQWIETPSPIMGGHSGGQMSTTLGIVELVNGACSLVAPQNIIFVNETEENTVIEEDNQNGREEAVMG